MKVYEFGKQNPEVILLLHGGGLSWWNFRKIALLLEERYHVILPVLDGHAGSDADFESIEHNAQRVIDYVKRSRGGHIKVLGGLSLGAQIAVAILAEKPDICDFALIESASLISSGFTHTLIGPTFSSSYFLIKYDWFSRLQFRSLHISEELYEDYYRDTCEIEKKNMIAFLKANTAYTLPESIKDTTAKLLVVVGEKEQKSMKKSAELLHTAKKGSELHIAKGLYHGELSLNEAEKYVELLQHLMGEN